MLALLRSLYPTVHRICKRYLEIQNSWKMLMEADIYKTSVCPLARVMRRELKKRGVKKLKVVYSKEQPTRPIEDMSISCRSHCVCPPGTVHKCTERRDIPGSIAFVPSVAGLILAGEVIKDLTK